MANQTAVQDININQPSYLQVAPLIRLTKNDISILERLEQDGVYDLAGHPDRASTVESIIYDLLDAVRGTESKSA